jgi:hypothetical protein
MQGATIEIIREYVEQPVRWEKLTLNRVIILEFLEFYIISFQNPHSIVSRIFNYLTSLLNTYNIVV